MVAEPSSTPGDGSEARAMASSDPAVAAQPSLAQELRDAEPEEAPTATAAAGGGAGTGAQGSGNGSDPSGMPSSDPGVGKTQSPSSTDSWDRVMDQLEDTPSVKSSQVSFPGDAEPDTDAKLAKLKQGIRECKVYKSRP